MIEVRPKYSWRTNKAFYAAGETMKQIQTSLLDDITIWNRGIWMPIWFEANRPKCKWSIWKFIYTKRSIWIPNAIIFNLHWLHAVILAKWFDIQPNAWVCQLIFHFTDDSILINIISNLQSIWRTFLNISHKRFKTIANVCWRITFVVWILIRSMNVMYSIWLCWK